VGDEVEREVEGGYGEDGSDGETLYEAPTAFVTFGEIEREAFTAKTRRFFRGGFEGEHGTVDFSAGEAEGLAGFGNDEIGESFLLFDEGRGYVFEDFATLPSREGAGAAKARRRVAYGLASVCAGGDGDVANEALIPWRADFEGFTVAPLLAAKEKACLRTWAHLHGLALLILS
jgi:hypothetical protein